LSVGAVAYLAIVVLVVGMCRAAGRSDGPAPDHILRRV